MPRAGRPRLDGRPPRARAAAAPAARADPRAGRGRPRYRHRGHRGDLHRPAGRISETGALPAVDHAVVTGSDLDALAARTDGYVGADIEAVCREASALATRSYLEDVDADDSRDVEALVVTRSEFEAAAETVDPSVTDDVRERYERYADRHGEQSSASGSPTGFH